MTQETYHWFPEPRGPPANILKRGTILAAKTQTTNQLNPDKYDMMNFKNYMIKQLVLRNRFCFKIQS